MVKVLVLRHMLSRMNVIFLSYFADMVITFTSVDGVFEIPHHAGSCLQATILLYSVIPWVRKILRC